MKNDLGGSSVASQINNTASVTTPRGQQEVQQVVTTGEAKDWEVYPVIAASPEFLSSTTKLDSFANGYADAAATLAAVRDNPDFALIDFAASDPQSSESWVADVTTENHRFDPFQVKIRNSANDAERTVTVIGIWSSRLEQKITGGVYVNAESFTSLFGEPDFSRTYVSLASGTDAKIAADGIELALATRGVEAFSVHSLIDDANAQERAFDRMFQGLMALGLLVGVAALGVIAFRSVVERRQQIGMLRAIGYQRESIALTFVMESGFIGLMGILSGVVGGVIVSRNIFTTGLFSDQGVDFTMPWGEVLVMVALALAVSLAMTWLPSRNAANVPVADALRYE